MQQLFLALALMCVGTIAHCSNAIDGTGSTEKNGGAWSGAKYAREGSLSVFIISSFYSGHKIPLLAVGEELVSRGHVVSFLTTEVNGSNLVPDIPRELGMHFISAGPDPRTKLEYEKIIYNLMGSSPMEQLSVVFMLCRDHTVHLRVACDQLNISEWDIVIADVVATNLIRYLDFKWGVKIILSTAVAADFASIDSPWPSPSVQCIDCTENMPFWQRFITALIYNNPLTRYIMTLWSKQFMTENDEVLWNRVSQDPLNHFLPDEFHPSLMYTAVGVDYARPHYPGVHMVGPVLRRSIPPLDSDLETWLSKKKFGKVVYISMGTTALVTESMAKGLVEGILATDYSAVWSLRESNQNILKGLEIDFSRFYVASWVSQVAIFRHEAIGLSILHGGTGGIHEALYFQVPIICIPFWYDQFSWANKIRDQGLGVVIQAKDVSAERVTESICEIERGDYKERAVRVSKILRQAGGSTRAADLVEFYAEVGYDHLVPAYIKYRWSWVQYYNADVYVVLLSVLVTAGLVVWRLILCLVRVACCRSGAKTKAD